MATCDWRGWFQFFNKKNSVFTSLSLFSSNPNAHKNCWNANIGLLWALVKDVPQTTLQFSGEVFSFYIFKILKYTQRAH